MKRWGLLLNHYNKRVQASTFLTMCPSGLFEQLKDFAVHGTEEWEGSDIVSDDDTSKHDRYLVLPNAIGALWGGEEGGGGRRE